MRKIIKEVIDHPLISSSTIVVIGLFMANGFNYLFIVAMGRFLSVDDYGILAALTSIVVIFSIFSSTIITVFTKFTASFIGKNKQEFIGPLFKNGTVIIGVIALIISLLIFIFSPQIAQFLHIDSLILVYITAASLFFLFVTSVVFGILQGSLRFFTFSFLNIVLAITKLIFGLSLVIAGYKVFGAVVGTLISGVVSYFLAVVFLRFILVKSDRSVKINETFKDICSYGTPVLLSSLGLTAMISIDIILTKHFFNPVMAGQYAALSLMGRSIFYLISPITLVFFSLVAQKNEKGEKLFGTVVLAAVLIGLPVIILSLIYFVFPSFVLHIFFPAKEYKILISYLGPFSIFILLYSLCWFLNSFYLSVGKLKVYRLTIFALFLEILAIFFFHQTILEIIYILITISLALLIVLSLYLPISFRKKIS
ncbi:hypothetical protein C4577_06125 [Candidatus Parcubacteria bacterium]|nr:MAG: hypothetical protein C4577_06125 [Candidatus Parcubacteria bacterium]